MLRDVAGEVHRLPSGATVPTRPGAAATVQVAVDNTSHRHSAAIETLR